MGRVINEKEEKKREREIIVVVKKEKQNKIERDALSKKIEIFVIFM